MTWRKREIMDMAREAGFIHNMETAFTFKGNFPQIEAFAKLVREDEREACANKTGEFAKKWWSIHCDSNKHMETTRKAHDDFCALQAAILARGQA